MIIIHNRGFIFSIDALIAFTIMLFSLLVFVIILSNSTTQLVKSTENFYLEEKTIFVADSFVKNFDTENSLLGACVFDLEKKRIKSNELTRTNFANMHKLQIDDFFVKQVIIKTHLKEERIFFDARNEKECVTVKRFVILDGEKAIVLLEGCLNE